MDKREARDVIGVIMAAYPRWSPPEATIRLYVAELADLDYSAAVAAARAHYRSCKWPPSIAELRSYVRDEAEAPTAGEALLQIQQRQRLHPLVSKAVSAVWGDLYQPDLSPRMLSMFTRIYDEMREREATDRVRNELTAGSQIRRLEEVTGT